MAYNKGIERTHNGREQNENDVDRYTKHTKRGGPQKLDNSLGVNSGLI